MIQYTLYVLKRGIESLILSYIYELLTDHKSHVASRFN